MAVCVVHLRRPIGADGQKKQQDQNRALPCQAMGHLGTNPKVNLIIMGDFNEGLPSGGPNQALAVLFQARPPLFDPLTTLKGKVATHLGGEAYDRILISHALAKGLSTLNLESIDIIPAPGSRPNAPPPATAASPTLKRSLTLQGRVTKCHHEP